MARSLVPRDAFASAPVAQRNDSKPQLRWEGVHAQNGAVDSSPATDRFRPGSYKLRINESGRRYELTTADGLRLETAENGRMLYVPPGCAHACQSLEDRSEIDCLASARYAADCVPGSRVDDPTVAVIWPLPPTNLSKQDQNWPLPAREEASAV
jgi:hypothetical protein